MIAMAKKKIIEHKEEGSAEAAAAAKKEAKIEKEAQKEAKKAKKSSKGKLKEKAEEAEVSEKAAETKKSKKTKTDEDIDAFNLEEIPEGAEKEAETSEIEQEIAGEEAEEKEEIQEERIYIVPLAKGYHKGASWYRSHKAIAVLRAFVTRHMKPQGDVYISQELNERIWENGIKNPPRKIRIRCTKSVDGIVRAYLA